MIRASFNDYPLDKELLKAIKMLGFERPTKVQSQVMDILFEKKDVILRSQTEERVIIVMGA